MPTHFYGDGLAELWEDLMKLLSAEPSKIKPVPTFSDAWSYLDINVSPPVIEVRFGDVGTGAEYALQCDHPGSERESWWEIQRDFRWSRMYVVRTSPGFTSTGFLPLENSIQSIRDDLLFIMDSFRTAINTHPLAVNPIGWTWGVVIDLRIWTEGQRLWDDGAEPDWGTDPLEYTGTAYNVETWFQAMVVRARVDTGGGYRVARIINQFQPFLSSVWKEAKGLSAGLDAISNALEVYDSKAGGAMKVNGVKLASTAGGWAGPMEEPGGPSNSGPDALSRVARAAARGGRVYVGDPSRGGSSGGSYGTT